MVATMARTVRSERGKVNLGCLFVVLALAAVVYFLLPVGLRYRQYYSLRQEMTTQANFASSVTDESIRNRVLSAIEESGLPPSAIAEAKSKLVVQRSGRPLSITVETSYSITFEVPFYQWTKRFEPSVRTRI